MHCSDGDGRTALVIGAHLMARMELTAEEAAKEVLAVAQEANIQRKCTSFKIKALVERGNNPAANPSSAR